MPSTISARSKTRVFMSLSFVFLVRISNKHLEMCWMIHRQGQIATKSWSVEIPRRLQDQHSLMGSSCVQSM
jgi:hypothetical protein